MKEYYKEVSRNQISLTDEEQEELNKMLIKHRDDLQSLIFQLPKALEIIYTYVYHKKSTATFSKDFNSYKKNNNNKISNRINNLVEAAIKAKTLESKIQSLKSCNFKEVFLMEKVLPGCIVDDSEHLIKQISNKIEHIREIENLYIKSILELIVKLGVQYKGNRDIDEAVQEANLAAVEAVRLYDPLCNTKFITYAYQKIIYSLKPTVADQKKSNVREMNLDESDSVNRERPLKEIISNDFDLEKIVHKRELNNLLKKEMKKVLTPTEYTVITTRYFSDTRLIPYEKIAKTLDKPVSRERIRQLENSALNKLKQLRYLKKEI